MKCKTYFRFVQRPCRAESEMDRSVAPLAWAFRRSLETVRCEDYRMVLCDQPGTRGRGLGSGVWVWGLGLRAGAGAGAGAGRDRVGDRGLGAVGGSCARVMASVSRAGHVVAPLRPGLLVFVLRLSVLVLRSLVPVFRRIVTVR